MPIGGDTHVSYGRLPHLSRPDKVYFVTFCTVNRAPLSPAERDIVLASCIYDHERLHWLHCVVVMPDHVHILTYPFAASIPEIMSRLKGASTHRVNNVRRRSGALWQCEYFDRIMRSDEDLAEKAEYIANNPVRKGLVARAQDYRWYWRPE